MNHPSSKHTSSYQSVSILVVDDEPGMQQILLKSLSKLFPKVDCAGSIQDAERLRQRTHYDLIILDINLPDRSGVDWYEAFESREYVTDVIFMTGYADLDTTIKALKLGASDFILKPFNLDQMLKSVQQCLDKRFEKRMRYALKRDFQRHVDTNIIGGSEKTKQINQTIHQYALSRASVLIQGESGTGKELIARGLHDAGERAGPFVPINCGSMSEQLLESELFGHVMMSFNGMSSTKEGLFQIANGGTLFLDEISEMPPGVQSALLRVLEERTIRPVGSNKFINVDIRVVAATNKNLKQEVVNGHFREDLFYRLNVLPIQVPPLRERKTDLIDLVPYFSKKLTTELGMQEPDWSEEDILAMHQYEWPGNVRELKNLVERCILIGKPMAKYWRELNFENPGMSGDKISVTLSHGDISTALPEFNNNYMGYPTEWSLKDVEKAHINQVVKYFDGNKSAAAKELGVSRKTLDRKYKEWESQELE